VTIEPTARTVRTNGIAVSSHVGSYESIFFSPGKETKRRTARLWIVRRFDLPTFSMQPTQNLQDIVNLETFIFLK